MRTDSFEVRVFRYMPGRAKSYRDKSVFENCSKGKERKRHGEGEGNGVFLQRVRL